MTIEIQMDESRCDTARMKINISWTENHKNKNISPSKRGVIVKKGKFRERENGMRVV